MAQERRWRCNVNTGEDRWRRWRRREVPATRTSGDLFHQGCSRTGMYLIAFVFLFWCHYLRSHSPFNSCSSAANRFICPCLVNDISIFSGEALARSAPLAIHAYAMRNTASTATHSTTTLISRTKWKPRRHCSYTHKRLRCHQCIRTNTDIYIDRSELPTHHHDRSTRCKHRIRPQNQ